MPPDQTPQGGTITLPLADSPRAGRSSLGVSSLAISIVYCALATFIGLGWLVSSRGEAADPIYASIVHTAHGDNYKPFVYRRLVFDSGLVLSRALPLSIWDIASNRIDGSPRVRHMVRDFLKWSRVDDPLLLSVALLVVVAALGFLCCTRALVLRLYDTPSWMAHLIALALGYGLLGARGTLSKSWLQYAYDIPQAFLFLGCALLAMRGSWWVLPASLVAAYNKETSVLLVPMILLVWPRRGSREKWLVAAAVLVGFALIQAAIRWHFRSAPSRGFLLIGTNIAQVFVFGTWRTLLWVVVAVTLYRHRKSMPWQLRRTAFLPVVLIAAAFFAGWVYEYRAYLEAYPFVGVMLIEVLVMQIGLGHLMRAKQLEAALEA